MMKFLSAAGVGIIALGLAATASAAPQKTRVHGTIASVSGKSVSVTSYGGKTVDLMLGKGTKYASVVASSLSNVKPGDFVGIGATGPNSRLAAMEVVVFPKSMRGTGEGHYGWSVPAAIARADRHEAGKAAPSAPPVHGTMTNGTVASTMPASSASPPVHGTMTNGTVSAKATRGAGGEDLTVSYGKGQQVAIRVSPKVPVVRFVPAHESVLKPGARLFAVATRSGAKGPLDAGFIAVGKNGLTPPM